jgi:hypothetical protein
MCALVGDNEGKVVYGAGLDVVGCHLSVAHAAVQVLGGELEGALDRRRPSHKKRE